jgi:hypothetical protein
MDTSLQAFLVAHAFLEPSLIMSLLCNEENLRNQCSGAGRQDLSQVIWNSSRVVSLKEIANRKYAGV